ncbi:type II toxin-antitoxin system HicB family antitoxin [Vibrio alginolyticus]|nr:type II toxin-antitoxin system HicB family antitoxin [Vibrio alginolyticus]HCG7649448.1 type II toxin-antitoxin system HicB family antitoxin [Vibrio parahaemolyticus]
MSNLLTYKGFYGSVSHSIEEEIIHGKIECINDLITYEAESIKELKAAFQEAVDDYLETCELIGKKPDKTMSGSFNVRIGPELHKKAFIDAKSLNMSLNEYVKTAVEDKLRTQPAVHMHLHLEKAKPAKEHIEFVSPYSFKATDNVIKWPQSEGKLELVGCH